MEFVISVWVLSCTACKSHMSLWLPWLHRMSQVVISMHQIAQSYGPKASNWPSPLCLFTSSHTFSMVENSSVSIMHDMEKGPHVRCCYLSFQLFHLTHHLPARSHLWCPFSMFNLPRYLNNDSWIPLIGYWKFPRMEGYRIQALDNPFQLNNIIWSMDNVAMVDLNYVSILASDNTSIPTWSRVSLRGPIRIKLKITY